MFSNLLVRGAFGLIYQFCKSGYRRFKSALPRVEEVQRQKLKSLIALAGKTRYGIEHGLNESITWEQFNERFPVTEYPDWSTLVDEQMKNGELVVSGDHVKRYQPTSGSTSKIKWIPYTVGFLNEFDEAVSCLVAHFFQKEKRLFKGKHYWSLSWIPTEHRNKVNFNLNDDMRLLPWYKRAIIYLTMAVPEQVAVAETSDGSMIATLAYLLKTRDLAFISVWSPTFALNLFDQIKNNRDDLINILEKGSWGTWERELSYIPCPMSKEAADILKKWDGKISSDFLMKVWPNMAMISSWDTSTSRIWAAELKKLFPHSTFQGKGLWATEGVVTIPYEGKYPLAVTSHFYEFLDIKTEKIYPAWDLQKGQVVKPLLSTGSGFFRYALNDRIEVVDFIDQCPCFLFKGRMDGIDMVGEKISTDIAQNILDSILDKFNVSALSLIGVTNKNNETEKPYYLVFCEGEQNNDLRDKVSKYAEELLLESFHYRLARDLNQLGHAGTLFYPDAIELYQKRATGKGMIQGNMKVEPLFILKEEDEQFFKIIKEVPNLT